MHRLLIVLLLIPLVSLAHQPVVSEFANYDDFQPIGDPAVSKAFYGTLQGYPHTYTLTLDTEAELFVQLLVPDVADIDTNVNGLVVHELPRGQVEAVTQLSPTDGSWDSFYEPFGGDSYLEGPEFKQVLPAGSYLIEISNAENVGRYVLATGELEQFDGLSYFETLKRIYEVKQFMGKSPLAMFTSPLFTVPFLLLVAVLYGGYRFYKKRYA